MDEIKTAAMESQFNRFQQKVILLLLDSEVLTAEDCNLHMKLLTMILLGAAIEFFSCLCMLSPKISISGITAQNNYYVMQNIQANWKIIAPFSRKQAYVYPNSEETKSHKDLLQE